MIGQFGARIEGNIKLIKFFDEMRLLRSLRPLRLLRLLRSLRPLRFLMPGKSLNVQSARCHTKQKYINKLKTLEKNFESCFTFFNPTASATVRVSVQGVESLWGDCRFIPADWGS